MALVLGFRGEPFFERLPGRHAIHVAALMRALLVVLDQISIQIFLHLVNGFIPRFSSHDAEVFVEDGLVQPLDEAVGLGTVDLGSAVLDPF